MSDPLDTDSTIVVVGASLAGLRAAEEIRHEGHTGPVVIVGDELHAPYDRPPLSKQFLAGTWDVERIHHHAPDKLDTPRPRLPPRTPGRCPSTSRPTRSTSTTAPRCTTTGWSWPPGPGPPPAGHRGNARCAHPADARRLPGHPGRPRVGRRPGPGVVVIGAGFIGSEVAATCHGLGAEVTVVEALPTPLARVLGERDGGGLRRAPPRPRGHRPHRGGRSARIASDPAGPATGGPAGRRDRPRRRCGGGRDRCRSRRRVAGGFGPRPRRTGWSAPRRCSPPTTWWRPGTWPAGSDPVPVSRSGSSTGPTPPRGGPPRPATCWPGRPPPSPTIPVPFFWSDQYETKIQVIGLPGPDDEVVVVDGSVDEGTLGGPLPAGRPAAGRAGLQPAPSADGLPPPAGRRGLVRRGAGRWPAA